MKFLAIDTSGKALTVIAYNGTRAETAFRTDCALRHSELLTDEIDGALSRAGMTAGDCDFFAAVTGPGSFTGLRIGAAIVNTLADQLQIPLYDQNGKEHKIILPDYGRPANISAPRK